MKKGLLLASMLVMGASAFAAKDPASYTLANGMTFTNISMNTNYVGTWNSLEMKEVPNFNRVRTGCILDGKVYVTSSTVFAGDGTADGGVMMVFDAATGEFEKTLQLTLDGQPFPAKLLGVNTIGVDSFGHLYIGGMVGTFFSNNEDGSLTANGLPLYHVTNPETGECTLITNLCLDEDDEAYSGRVDYINLIGDITRQEGRCVVMCSISGDYAAVGGWACDQGEDEWYGHMSGDTATAYEYDSSCFYPEVVSFSTAGTVNIIEDESEDYNNFYCDEFNTRPTLLTTDGSSLGNFDGVEDELQPKDSPTGCNEFTMGDDVYYLYPMNDYDGGALSNLVKLGPAATFEGMTHVVTFPASGMGELGAGQGPRIQCYQADVVTDDNGKNGAYIFTFKSMNGFAYYLFAEEGFAGAGVDAAVVEDVNAPVEYFNLQGISVANPENGIFIRRQGNKVSKVTL
ncbi:MAG: hypothetical protein K2M55_08750 [Muribaculaceae bacterium]|nr:hypothetical protein [Muribaculaceae bacterium]